MLSPTPSTSAKRKPVHFTSFDPRFGFHVMLRFSVFLFFVAPLMPAGAGEPSWPGRYQSPPKTHKASLKAVWGQPEQAPALGHTAVMTPDGKYAVTTSGGTLDADGNT